MCAEASWAHTKAITVTNKNRFIGTSTKLFFDYLPIIRIVNEPGIGAPRAPRPPPGGGGGAGPRSSLIAKMWFVLLSYVIVRVPLIVCCLCSTANVGGLFSLYTVSVPLI